MADRELVAALVRLLEPPNEQRRADYAARITAALDQGRRAVPIPGVAARPVTVTVDWVTFMFCYPWRGKIGPDNPYPDENFARQPLEKYADQSTTAYGKWSFETAGAHGVDVMVGFWSQFNVRPLAQNVFLHFRDSISLYDGGQPWPRVAYSMEYEKASDDQVRTHLDDLRKEFKLRRHYRFPDRNGRQRFPVIFWGIKEVLDEARIDDTAKLLDELAGINVGGATPYVIWHANLLDAWAGWKSKEASRPFADLLKKKVLRRIDAVYQHECNIPEPQGLTWGQVDRHNWKAFPHDKLDSAATIAKTRSWKQLLDDDAKEDKRNGQQPLDLYVIPGTMPQFSRERYDSARQQPTDRVTQARVNCTDVKQVRTSLKNMRDEATSVSVEQTGPSALLARRMVALTSWNEWREGSTWEPCRAGDNDPNDFGITDSTGALLDEVKGTFADAVIEYTLGGGGGGGGDGGGGDKGGDKGHRGHDGKGDPT